MQSLIVLKVAAPRAALIETQMRRSTIPHPCLLFWQIRTNTPPHKEVTPMTNLFLEILNTSLSATWLVLAIVLLRFLLKKTPKWINVLLWGLVALRLLFPFSLESALSLIPSAEVVSPEIMLSPAPTIHTGVDAINSAVNPILTEALAPDPVQSANPLQILIPILSGIWCLGMALMAVYAALSYARLLRRVRTAIRATDNIYLSEYVSSPFVLGLFRPRIYLPYHMNDRDRTHVIAHERTHIQRRDHLWKPLGFALLTIHWFNPILWVAYILLCRDIELACDEKVIQKLGRDQRADYSQALLHCSVTHRSIAACPLAFGEVGVKERVKNVLHYRKPAFWVIVLCLILVAVLSVCFLTDPKSTEFPQELLGKTCQITEVTYADPRFSSIWTEVETPYLSVTEDQHLLLKNGILSDNSETTWEDRGLLEATDLTRDNFDALIHETGSCDPASYRRNNRQAWTLRYTTDNGVFLMYLLSQKDGTLYLAYGYDRTEEESGETLIRWLLKLEPAETATWSVTMTAYNVDRTSAFLIMNQTGAIPDGDIFVSQDYTLQKRINDQWEDLPLPENHTPTADTEIVAPDTHTLQNIDWSNLHGSLSQGHYRIKKTASMNGETRNLYAEFMITEPSGAVSFDLENVTPTGLDLYIREEQPETGSYVMGSGFFLQVLTDSGWTAVPPLEDSAYTKLLGVNVLENDSWQLEWSYLYGELPEGTYRVCRDFSLMDVFTPIVQTVSEEFTIGNNWDISVLADRFTADSLQLSVHFGENTPAGDYYLDGYSVQSYTHGWTDILPMTDTPKNRQQNLLKDSSITILWNGESGELSNFNNRAFLRIRRVTPGGEEEFHTFYAYFIPDGWAWGVSFEIDTTHPNGPLTMGFTELLSAPEIPLADGELTYQPGFRLQKRANNQWNDMELLSDPSWLTIDYRLPPGALARDSYDWTPYYGILTDGAYRICKDITRHFADGTEEIRTLYATFTVDGTADQLEFIGFDHPLDFLNPLDPATLTATAAFPETNTGITLEPDLTEQLVSLLSNLSEDDLNPILSHDWEPRLTITLSGGEHPIVLYYDGGNLVFFDFGEERNAQLGCFWNTANDSLTAFFAELLELQETFQLLDAVRNSLRASPDKEALLRESLRLQAALELRAAHNAIDN